MQCFLYCIVDSCLSDARKPKRDGIGETGWIVWDWKAKFNPDYNIQQ